MERKFWSFGDKASYFGVVYKSRPHRTMYDMFIYFPSSVLDYLVLVQLPLNVTVECSLKDFSISFPLVFRAEDTSLAETINSLINNHSENPIGKLVFEFFSLLWYHLNEPSLKTSVLDWKTLDLVYLGEISSRLLPKLESSVRSTVKNNDFSVEIALTTIKPTLAIHHDPPVPTISFFGGLKIQRTERRGDEIIVHHSTDKIPSFDVTFRFPLIVLFQLRDVIAQPKCLMKTIQRVEKFFNKRPVPLLGHPLRDGFLPWFWNTYIPLVLHQLLELRFNDPYRQIFTSVLGLSEEDTQKVLSCIDTVKSSKGLKVRYRKVEFNVSVVPVLPSLTHIVTTYPLKTIDKDEFSKLESGDKEIISAGKVYYTVPRLSPFYVFEVVGPIPETAGRSYQLFREVYLFDNNEELFDGLLNDFSREFPRPSQLITALSFFINNAGTGSFHQLVDFYFSAKQK